MPLEREMETYREKLPELVQHEGKYVLIRGDAVADVFATYEDALRQGYRAFGLDSFLVKQIHAVEPVKVITRVLTPALRG
jgi:hypothetical protein